MPGPMKYLFLFLLLPMIFPISLNAQGGEAIDNMFDKYSEKEGFTSVYISSRMFSMFSSQDIKDEELKNLMSRLKSIRILTVEDSTLNLKLNFYEELKRSVDFSTYEELMTVREGNEVTRFLIKETGIIISELLIVSGGKSGNTLISIKGDLDLKNISSLSKTIGIQQLENLEKLEKKPPEE